eukprot:jgi/Pico_ML_1/52836/g3485.t1
MLCRPLHWTSRNEFGGGGMAAPGTAPWDSKASLLIEGARYGDVEDVQMALDGGADVNAADDLGRTALHMASANGHEALVQMLLDAGSDVGVVNTEKNTPLHWACLNGHERVVTKLMQYGASPTALNVHERTPVDEAMLFQKEGVLQVMRKLQDRDPEGGDPEDGLEDEVEADEIHTRDANN